MSRRFTAPVCLRSIVSVWRTVNTLFGDELRRFVGGCSPRKENAASTEHRVIHRFERTPGRGRGRQEGLVLWARLELARLAPLPPQDSVSTNSTTRALPDVRLPTGTTGPQFRPVCSRRRAPANHRQRQSVPRTACRIPVRQHHLRSHLARTFRRQECLPAGLTALLWNAGYSGTPTSGCSQRKLSP